MIVNAYSVLAAFVGLVEVVLGAFLAVLGARAIRARRRAATTDASLDRAESRLTLLLLQASVLLGVGVASWPLLYLVLGSYVPEWPGVMCIRGVVKIGTGSLGPAAWLPTLLSILEVTKPLLVFATGTWLVLHLANRRTRSAPLAGRVLVALTAVGFLATVDGAAQLSYLGIPKQERYLNRGCCTVPSEVASRSNDGAALLSVGSVGGGAERSHAFLWAAFLGLSAAMALSTLATGRRPADRSPLGRFAPAVPLLGAAVSIPLGLAFLSEVAAPAFLGAPGHHCAYCALGSSPLFGLAIGLFLLGVFATGWASLARWFAVHAETDAFLPGQVARLSYVAAFGYVGAVVVVAVRLVAA